MQHGNWAICAAQMVDRALGSRPLTSQRALVLVTVSGHARVVVVVDVLLEEVVLLVLIVVTPAVAGSVMLTSFQLCPYVPLPFS